MTAEEHIFALLAAMTYRNAKIEPDAEPKTIFEEVDVDYMTYVIGNYQLGFSKDEGEPWRVLLTANEGAKSFDDFKEMLRKERARVAGVN